MKKLYYIPGMFSIVLLPVLGIWYMNKHDYFTELRSIDFNSVKEWRKEDSSYDAYEYDKRIYKEVYLKGDINAASTFKYIDQFVNDVVQTKDTMNGLKIHFEQGSTYKEFIDVLNIFAKRQAEMYILDHNTMYFVGKDWNPNAKESEIEYDDLVFLDCGGWYNDKEEENNNFSSFVNNLKTQFGQNKTIYSAYIFLFVIALIPLRNLKRSKSYKVEK